MKTKANRKIVSSRELEVRNASFERSRAAFWIGVKARQYLVDYLDKWSRVSVTVVHLHAGMEEIFALPDAPTMSP